MAVMLAAGRGGGSGAISASSALDPESREALSPSPISGKHATTGGEGVMAPRLRKVMLSNIPWLDGERLSDLGGVGGVGGVGLGCRGLDMLPHTSTVICLATRWFERCIDFGLGSLTIPDIVACL